MSSFRTIIKKLKPLAYAGVLYAAVGVVRVFCALATPTAEFITHWLLVMPEHKSFHTTPATAKT
jgi:hypothetical protein